MERSETSQGAKIDACATSHDRASIDQAPASSTPASNTAKPTAKETTPDPSTDGEELSDSMKEQFSKQNLIGYVKNYLGDGYPGGFREEDLDIPDWWDTDEDDEDDE
ncbi:hypothetical protein BGZ73_003166 [Actinomortierella ambigua]|nr:hypothetical protein BGZ73_003166 [Actinomortierella ambigua]